MSPTCPPPTPVLSLPNTKGVVRNFRAVAGHKKIFRCAAPDNLGEVLTQLGANEQQPQADWDEPERTLLYDATLILDLRMESEIDAKKYRALTQLAPGGPFLEVSSLEELKNCTARRQLFCPSGNEGFTRSDLLTHTGNFWVSHTGWDGRDPAEKAGIMVQELNKRGLPGLFEVFLEMKAFMRTVLQSITVHLESNPDGKVVVHCSIGKDRTGVISMLCSKMLGMEDSDVLNDFSKSIVIRDIAVKKFQKFFGDNVDSEGFALSKEEAMQEAITNLLDRYGSIPLYLDSIGFGRDWQTRFRKAAS